MLSVQQFRPRPPKATDIKTEICPVPMATWEQASNKANGVGGGVRRDGRVGEVGGSRTLTTETLIIRRLQGTTPTRAGSPGGGASLRCLGFVFVSLISKFSAMAFNFF